MIRGKIQLFMVCFASLCSSIGTTLISKRPPGPLLKTSTILECKNHKDVKKKLQRFGRAVTGSFQERGDVWVMEH